MGFDKLWCSWISKCVTSASISILVNGSPTPCFSSARGLRQDWAASIGFSVGHFPSDYLGLPLGPKRNSTSLWDPVVKKFHDALAYLKENSLDQLGFGMFPLR